MSGSELERVLQLTAKIIRVHNDLMVQLYSRKLRIIRHVESESTFNYENGYNRFSFLCTNIDAFFCIELSQYAQQSFRHKHKKTWKSALKIKKTSKA